ncbi:MAG: ABC transporter ATP-binding protein [Clostridiaceae bacterium]|nr:ABC transporter ATP-binding protein [Clostridiaceae bacterium]
MKKVKQDKQKITMGDVLRKRRRGFILYLIGALLPIFQQLIQQAMFSYAFGIIDATTRKESLVKIAVLFAGLVVPSFFHYVSRRMRIGFMRDILLDIRKLGFRRIIDLPVRVFSRQSRDVYLSNLVNDINIIENDFFLSFLNVLFNGGVAIFGFLLLLFVDRVFAVIVLALTIAMGLLGRLFAGRLVKLKAKESEANKDFSLKMSNVFSGLEILKLNQVEDRFQDQSNVFIAALERVKIRFNIFDRFQSGTMDTLGYACTVLSFFYVGVRIAQGQLDLVRGMLIAMITQSCLFSIVRIFPHRNKLLASRSIFDKVVNGDPSEKQELAAGDRSFSFNRSLDVEGLSFSYGNQNVLRHVTFSVNPGEKVLLKGASGSGKTTLLNLLAGVYTDYEGEIRYDGTELRSIHPASHNKQIAEIYQDVFLFEDTLRQNIVLYEDYTEEEVRDAVEKAGLSELIERLPDGLDTMLEENGKNLSGGERQRVSIARAVIRGAKLILADEATSNLDESLGRHIEETLLSLDATVIAISHRYYEGVTERYDTVLELKSGTMMAWHVDDYFTEVV